MLAKEERGRSALRSGQNEFKEVILILAKKSVFGRIKWLKKIKDAHLILKMFKEVLPNSSYKIKLKSF